MYKDLDRRRDCAREKQRAYRLRKSGVTPVLPPEVESVTPVTPEFVKGMGNWAKLRGSIVTPDKARPAVKAVVEKRDSQPVPDWRAQKDRQMAEWIKRNAK